MFTVRVSFATERDACAGVDGSANDLISTFGPEHDSRGVRAEVWCMCACDRFLKLAENRDFGEAYVREKCYVYIKFPARAVSTARQVIALDAKRFTCVRVRVHTNTRTPNSLVVRAKLQRAWRMRIVFYRLNTDDESGKR